MSYIYFITHPEVEIDPEVPVIEWSLNDEGRARTNSLLRQTWIKDVNLIYSSDELKAHQTAEMIAHHLNLEVLTHSKLGEVNRSSTGFMPERELDKIVREFFLKPARSVAGWEKAALAQKRIVKCVKDIIETNPDSSIAMVSHGMVGALLMCHIKNVPIHRRYMQHSLGSYFIYNPDDNEIVQEWRRIDPST